MKLRSCIHFEEEKSALPSALRRDLHKLAAFYAVFAFNPVSQKL